MPWEYSYLLTYLHVFFQHLGLVLLRLRKQLWDILSSGFSSSFWEFLH